MHSQINNKNTIKNKEIQPPPAQHSYKKIDNNTVMKIKFYIFTLYRLIYFTLRVLSNYK